MPPRNIKEHNRWSSTFMGVETLGEAYTSAYSRSGPIALTIFSGDVSIPVEFNFMQPARSGRWPVRQRRLARLDEAGLAPFTA